MKRQTSNMGKSGKSSNDKEKTKKNYICGPFKAGTKVD